MPAAFDSLTAACLGGRPTPRHLGWRSGILRAMKNATDRSAAAKNAATKRKRLRRLREVTIPICGALHMGWYAESRNMRSVRLRHLWRSRTRSFSSAYSLGLGGRPGVYRPGGSGRGEDGGASSIR